MPLYQPIQGSAHGVLLQAHRLLGIVVANPFGRIRLVFDKQIVPQPQCVAVTEEHCVQPDTAGDEGRGDLPVNQGGFSFCRWSTSSLVKIRRY